MGRSPSLSNPTPLQEQVPVAQLIFSQTAGKSCNYPRNKTSPAAESGKLSWLQSSRAGSTRGTGAWHPHCSQTLPPWLCQPHTLLSMDAAPPSRQHQVFQLCPQQRGNAEGYTLLQELSSAGDTQLILRPSRQARVPARTPKAPKSMSRQGVFPHGPGFLQCPALPPTSAHSSHKSKHPQGAPGKPSTPVTGMMVYELMFQRFFEDNWPRDCQRFCSSPGLKFSPNLAQPHALLLALT